MAVDGETVNVEFFGDHSQLDVSAEDCVLYSERTHGRNAKQDLLVKAKKVNFSDD